MTTRNFGKLVGWWANPLCLVGRTLSAAGLALVLLSAASGPVGASALYGLAIGIDDYIGIQNDLEGAVRDANDVSSALKRAGAAEVITLLDRAATKAAIEAAWNALVDKAVAGDTIVFSYAGHGSQEPEPPGRSDEKDGKNENFLLALYQTKGEGTKERIVDDEIFQWLKRADDKQIRVVFVADSCHSGSMNRSARSEAVKFRNGNFGTITDDQLQLPSEAAAKLTEDDYQNVTFVGATSEDQLTPEVAIDGQKRGALSWAVARAVEGRADFNGDGAVTQLELLGYVVPAVHAHVESQQTPQIRPHRARSVTLFSVRGIVEEKKDALAEARTLRLFVDGGEAPVLTGVESIKIVSSKSDADLIWYVRTGKVEHVVGGVVAESVGPTEIKPVAIKWAALKWLKAHAALDPVSVKLPLGNQRYAKGETVQVSIQGAKYPYLTLFNLPPDGRVEFFIPDPKRRGEDSKDWRGDKLEESFRVADPPFGAEHLVAVFSKEILSDLHAVLSSMSTADSAAALRGILEQVLHDKEFQVGVLDIYTGRAN